MILNLHLFHLVMTKRCSGSSRWGKMIPTLMTIFFLLKDVHDPSPWQAEMTLCSSFDIRKIVILATHLGSLQMRTAQITIKLLLQMLLFLNLRSYQTVDYDQSWQYFLVGRTTRENSVASVEFLVDNSLCFTTWRCQWHTPDKTAGNVLLRSWCFLSSANHIRSEQKKRETVLYNEYNLNICIYIYISL